MKRIVLAGLVLTVLLPASATDKPMKVSDMPAVVQDTIRQQTKSASIRRTLTEIENRETFYECESLQNGRTRDFLVDKTGAVVEVEDQASLEEVPAPVKMVVQRAASGVKLTKLERVKEGQCNYLPGGGH
jgi:hypothetical protein